MKKAVVLGGAGFLGQHLCRRLVSDGYDVLAIDRKEEEFPMPGKRPYPLRLDDLTTPDCPHWWFGDVDEVYQLACEVGGLGYIHDKNNDAIMLRNSVQINLNVLEAMVASRSSAKLFFSSSACVYPTLPRRIALRGDPRDEITSDLFILERKACREQDAYPAQCDNEYAWEKLFSERLYDAYARNHGLDVRIARIHNCLGTFHTYDGGREKAPAAICRKVAQAPDGGTVEVWGDGQQTRSFMYVDDCVEGIRRLMSLGPVTRADGSHPAVGPVNLGSSEMVTVDQMTDIVIGLSGKTLTKVHVPGEQGVRGRSSDNSLLRSLIDWEPSISLAEGLAKTWPWVRDEVKKAARS